MMPLSHVGSKSFGGAYAYHANLVLQAQLFNRLAMPGQSVEATPVQPARSGLAFSTSLARS